MEEATVIKVTDFPRLVVSSDCGTIKVGLQVELYGSAWIPLERNRFFLRQDTVTPGYIHILLS